MGEVQQLVPIGSSSSLHSEACTTGPPPKKKRTDGITQSSISQAAASFPNMQLAFPKMQVAFPKRQLACAQHTYILYLRFKLMFTHYGVIRPSCVACATVQHVLPMRHHAAWCMGVGADSARPASDALRTIKMLIPLAQYSNTQ